jgi:hypothetical protein
LLRWPGYLVIACHHTIAYRHFVIRHYWLSILVATAVHRHHITSIKLAILQPLPLLSVFAIVDCYCRFPYSPSPFGVLLIMNHLLLVIVLSIAIISGVLLIAIAIVIPSLFAGYRHVATFVVP